MQLQPNEQVIITSDDKKVILSNYRLCSTFKEWGHSSVIFINLEDISSIQSVYKSVVLFLLLAGICGLGGAFVFFTMHDMEPQGLAAIGIGLFFLILWFATRKRIISIHPDGGKPLEFEANSMKEAQVLDFLEQVQLAKTNRINTLYKI